MGIVSDNCTIQPLEGVSREQWLEMRKDCLGGSDAGVILGLSKYASPYSLWAEKLGLAEREDAGFSAEMGNLLEPTVALLFARETGLRVVKWDVMLRSKARPWASANVDYWISDDECFDEGVVNDWGDFDDPAQEPPGLYAVGEMKTSAIASHGTNHLWEDGEIPQSYLAQGYHYASVTGLHDIWFGALLGGEGFVHRHVEFDEEICEGLQEREDEFWNNHIINREAPEADGSKATEDIINKRYPKHQPGKTVEGGEALAALWDDYRSAKEYAASWAEKEKTAKAQIVELIGDAESATVNGEKIFSYKTQKGRTSIDAKRLEEEFPEAFSVCQKSGSSYRVMRPSKS